MIFYVFYSSFSLHDSLENVFYEQLEWLKFQKSVPPQIPIGGGGGGGLIAHSRRQCENLVDLKLKI